MKPSNTVHFSIFDSKVVAPKRYAIRNKDLVSIKTYACAWRKFFAWSVRSGYDPLRCHGKELLVKTFLVTMSRMSILKYESTKTYLAGIRYFYAKESIVITTNFKDIRRDVFMARKKTTKCLVRPNKISLCLNSSGRWELPLEKFVSDERSKDTGENVFMAQKRIIKFPIESNKVPLYLDAIKKYRDIREDVFIAQKTTSVQKGTLEFPMESNKVASCLDTIEKSRATKKDDFMAQKNISTQEKTSKFPMTPDKMTLCVDSIGRWRVLSEKSISNVS